MTSNAGNTLASADRSVRAATSFGHSAAPVTRRDHFAGRRQSLHDLQHVLLTPGQHALVLGEPGIGRSSLLAMVPGCLEGPRRAALVAVERDDTLATLWARSAAALQADTTAANAGEIAELLRRMAGAVPVMWAVDDVHRASPALRAELAALVGALVSPAVPVTLVFSGAGLDARRVWPEAALLGAAMGSFVLPRLTGEESQELLDTVLAGAGLDAEPAAAAELIEASAGRPGAMRDLAERAAAAAQRQGVGRVSESHAEDAMREALEATDAGVREEYQHATIRARRGIFPEILWACARSPRETDGSFSTQSVRDTLQRLLKREVRGLTNQISVLAESTRGQVLEKVSGAPNPRYRFVDPRLEPFVLLRGLGDRDLPHIAASDHANESWLRKAA